MKISVMKAIIDLLNADPTLTGYLGGEHVFPGHISQGYEVPCVTVMENSEGSVKRVGYFSIKVRDQRPVIQIDAWKTTTAEDVDQIMNRVDELLLPDPVAGSWGWEKVSTSGAVLDPDLRAYHASARFSFMYSITDT